MGGKGYEEGLAPILEAFGFTTSEGRLNKLKTAQEFDKISTSEEMLNYIVDLVFALVDEIAQNPVEYLAKNLASVLYFLGSDNVYNAVSNVLAFVNSLLAQLDPVYKQNGIRIDLSILKLDDTTVGGKTTKGLISTVNDALAKANINFQLTSKMILDLAGKLGDYAVVPTVNRCRNSRKGYNH